MFESLANAGSLGLADTATWPACGCPVTRERYAIKPSGLSQGSDSPAEQGSSDPMGRVCRQPMAPKRLVNFHLQL